MTRAIRSMTICHSDDRRVPGQKNERSVEMDFHKTVRLGTRKTAGGRSVSVYCAIRYKEGRLSISGVEGPLLSGNCVGSAGQIVAGWPDRIRDMRPAPGWNRSLLTRFFETWDAWHLNDMRAGSPAQQAELRKYGNDGRTDNFAWRSLVLAEAGINPDPTFLVNGEPYRYGTAGLFEPVPEDVISFLRSLPDTDRTPAWV